MSYIDSGKEQGAKLHIGGGRVGDEGYFIEVHLWLFLPSRVTSGLTHHLICSAHNLHRN